MSRKEKEIHTAEVRRKEERNEDWMKTLTMCRHKEEKKDVKMCSKSDRKKTMQRNRQFGRLNRQTDRMELKGHMNEIECE